MIFPAAMSAKMTFTNQVKSRSEGKVSSPSIRLSNEGVIVVLDRSHLMETWKLYLQFKSSLRFITLCESQAGDINDDLFVCINLTEIQTVHNIIRLFSSWSTFIISS